jgi:hypothetical protein
MSPLVSGEKPVAFSGCEPGCGEYAPRLAGDGLIDHLAVDCADAFAVLSEDGAGFRHRLGGRRQRAVDRTDLRRVNGGLGGEAERDRVGDLLFQASLVVNVEKTAHRSALLELGRRRRSGSRGRREAAAKP